MLVVLGLVHAVCAADVVINEAMVNPYGPDSAELSEWVELYNASEEAVSLAGWTLVWGTSDYSSEHALSPVVLEPGDHYVISEEGMEGGDEPAVFGFGNATSTADAIQLRTADGAPHDTLIYGDDNPEGWLDNAGTVALSLAPKPGEGQSIGRHTDGVDVDRCGDDFVLFDEPTMGDINLMPIIDGDGDGDGDADADADADADVDADADADADDTAWMTSDCDPLGDVKINEILPNPDGPDSGYEWIELYNPSSSDTVELGGWTITWNTGLDSETGEGTGGGEFTFETLSLGPEAFLLIGAADVEGADVVTSINMGNAASNADRVQLVDCDGGVKDTVVYGPSNDGEDDDQFIDDSGEVATSLAPKPSDGLSLSRTRDGGDTNQSGVDFVRAEENTPGAPNPFVEPVECVPGSFTIKLNELMANPDGSDGGFEWIELYNPSSSDTVELGGWTITWNTGLDDDGRGTGGGEVTFGAGVLLEPEGFLLIGDVDVEGADIVTSINMGNAGSNADRVQLVDCDGAVQDTVVYGPSNDGEDDDQFVDDLGEVATSLAPKPSDGSALARVRDGQDTDLSGEDFIQTADASPGGPNLAPSECTTSGDGESIKINEFMPNPEGTDDGYEWVELFNAGDSTVALDGWMVLWNTSESSGGGYTFASDISLASGEFLLLGAPAVGGADFTTDMSLGNASGSSDRLQLVDCAGEPQDTVIYGTPNTDEFLDDLGDVTASPALKPGDGVALARTVDGFDTDVSLYDFVLAEEATPGAPNPYVEPVVCVAGDVTVKINELLPDPDGTDGGLEFVELYNSGTEAVSLDGWGIMASSSEFSDEPQFTFPGGTQIAAGGFLVVGGEDVEEADLLMSDGNTFTLGNGSKNPDGVRLVDCDGFAVQDTVLYGDASKPIEDFALKDDLDGVSMAGMPRSGLSVGRITDGVDTDNNESDFQANMAPTPGSANGEVGASGAGGEGALDDGCGCGGKSGPGDADSPAEASALAGLMASIALFIGLRRREDQ